LHVVATKAEASTGRQGSSWRASKKRRQVIRADQATVIADAMNPFCGIGCLLFAVVAFTQFSFDQMPGSWASSSVAALTSVVLGVCFLVLRSARWGPVLRAHALPFGITVGARERWLHCMNQALDEARLPADADRLLRAFFDSVATMLINRHAG